MAIIRAAQLVIEERDAGGPCGPSSMGWISEPGGLTQFGAFIEVLLPGSRSSLKHWHSGEDEMVYVLEGEIAVVEGDQVALLGPGDVATFRAGDPVGHYLENRGSGPTRCLVVGTRAPVDTITYPDHDRICHRDRALPDDIWSDGEGKPASNAYAEATVRGSLAK